MRTSLSLSRGGTNLSFFDEKGKAPQERCFSSIPEETADENSTTTSIKKLTRQQSIEELVRINGGSGITEAGLIHATEMKDMADRTKSNLF